MQHEHEPAISVIMPAYNAEAYIEEALSSILAQDFNDFEVVVVDDGSTDTTFEVVTRFAENDSRIQAITQPHANAGAARNAGMNYACGHYLLFLDADDVFEPNMLSCLYNAAQNSHAQITMCAADCFTEDAAHPVRPWDMGAHELSAGTYAGEKLAARLYQCITVVVWNKLFEADFIRTNGIAFQEQPRFNDAFFAIMALAHAQTITKIDDVLVHYRVGVGTSLVDKETSEPYCDLQTFDVARKALEAQGLLSGPLKRSFDTLCVNTITWRLIHFARRDEHATKQLYDAYFNEYEHAWGLDTTHWPYLQSARYALEYALIKRKGVEGLVKAARVDARTRASGRDASAELAFIRRLAACKDVRLCEDARPHEDAYAHQDARPHQDAHPHHDAHPHEDKTDG